MTIDKPLFTKQFNFMARNTRQRKPKLPTRQAKPKVGKVIDDLYNAVNAYVKSIGGSIIVIGGIELQEWTIDSEFKFRVAVHCLGKKPTKFLKNNKNESEDWTATPVSKVGNEYGKHLSKI